MQVVVVVMVAPSVSFYAPASIISLCDILGISIAEQTMFFSCSERKKHCQKHSILHLRLFLCLNLTVPCKARWYKYLGLRSSALERAMLTENSSDSQYGGGLGCWWWYIAPILPTPENISVLENLLLIYTKHTRHPLDSIFTENQIKSKKPFCN